MRRLRALGSVVVLLIVVAWTAVSAAGGPPVTIPERAHGAKKVVVATTSSVTPQWRTNSHGDQLIVSQIGLQVEETLKGTPAPFHWLELEGGTLNGVTLHVSHLPDLKPGERAVFFLDETNTGTHVPHLQGLGILKLDANGQVQGSGLHLGDIRRMVAGQ